MPYSFINHKGKRVLFVDYTHCKTANDMIKQLEEIKDLYQKSNFQFLALNDFTGTYGSSEFMNKAKEHKELFDSKTLKTAVLGITGLKKVLLNGYNMFVQKKQVPFNTKEEALDYLVS